MICPKCESEEILIIHFNHPQTFECRKCGHVFLKLKKALIDE